VKLWPTHDNHDNLNKCQIVFLYVFWNFFLPKYHFFIWWRTFITLLDELCHVPFLTLIWRSWMTAFSVILVKPVEVNSVRCQQVPEGATIKSIFLMNHLVFYGIKVFNTEKLFLRVLKTLFVAYLFFSICFLYRTVTYPIILKNIQRSGKFFKTKKIQ